MKTDDDYYSINNLTLCDVAYIRMALKDSVELMQQIHDKFIEQKKPKKMIRGAKKNLDWAIEKLDYFESKLSYQNEWLKKNFQKICAINNVLHGY